MNGRGLTKARVGALAVLLAGTVGMGAAIRVGGLHLRKTAIYPPQGRQLSNIPAETPGWTRLGSDQIESPEVLEVLKTDNYLTRRYLKRGTGENGVAPVVIELHAAYYTGMIDTVPHVPERCFVGGGWQQANASRVLDLDMAGESWVLDRTVEPEYAGVSGAVYTVRLNNDPAYSDAPGRRVRLPLDVGPERPMRMRMSEYLQTEGGKFHAGYFFIANGGTVPNANDVRALAFNLTDDYAYYVKVQVNSSSSASVEELAEHSADLLDDLIGEIMRCVPDWVEVERGNYPASDTAGTDGQGLAGTQ